MNRLWIIAVFISSFGFSQPKKELITVHFDSNSAAISKTEAKQLKLFFSDRNQSITTLQIHGFCDDVGSSESNLALSEKRALAVAGYLKAHFKLSASEIAGKGEIELVSTSEYEIEKERTDHRSVTIAIEYAEKNIEEKPVEEGYKTFGDKLAVGDKVIIDNIIFVSNSKVFEDYDKATAELQKIIAYFQKNPTVEFEINGHVCCISKSFRDAHDRATGLNNLSESRAKSIYDYFVENGIAKERMSHKGYGRQFPRPGLPEKENKRVEIVITKL
ncbi:OmpA family protein [Flavobacterium sp. GT3R68]|uniref:OmpA family protein n=1 Tax=Flavobacterium sp. GT3R68 TaxID=2594437 RepID=UPI000F864DD0|nr:OmpA family protein [Flavobacterium sp. GT3R68]RTY95864.1 hypothetical protein EKL32_04250 [Flavobacterium sp. GSN2]TRW93636.1 OmpA family protein [Flavobacterium sp. GT3R68]